MVLKKRIHTKTNDTRNRIIDVARKLFALHGADNTTMNDIADASNRGRRTLYLYFKNKEEILRAIIDTELMILYNKVKGAKNVIMKSDDKLLFFMYTHLESMKNLVSRNGSLKADFFRDIWQVEKSRAEFDKKEAILIQEILKDGIEEGIFTNIPDIPTMSMLLVNAIKGLEIPYISGWMRHKNGVEFDIIKECVITLIFNGIKANNEVNTNSFNNINKVI